MLEERKISAIFSYGTGDNGEGPPEVIELTGHRVSVSAVLAGFLTMGQLQMRLYGLRQSTMNRLSTMGKLPFMLRKNTVRVLASSGNAKPSTVYQGSVIAAWVDMGGAPNVVFNVTAAVGAYEEMLPVAPLSVPDGASVVSLLEPLAQKLGLDFEDGGVTAVLPSGYYPGSARKQITSIIQHCDCAWNGMADGVLAVWPKGGYRTKQPIVELSPETGMVGYPSYTQMGVIVKTLYNPEIKCGSRVRIKSSLPQASGEWDVYSLAHELEAQTPGGQWFTTIEVSPPGYVRR